MSGALKLSCSSLIFVLSFRCRRMKSRAEPPIPGEGIPPSRWSTCHLSWPGMPIPGAVAALGMPRNRGGQVSSGHPLESNQNLRYPEEPRSQRLETTAPRHTRSTFQHPRPTEDGFCLLLFQKSPRLPISPEPTN
ncbi:uncharacterized protein LOC143694263 [Agelaius phoeniceus]|uniref:uncharacterized protein LOC143694263 n=1 Tax=Agelaius phoeniceus TaxID=39638 RepID=UPI004054B710